MKGWYNIHKSINIIHHLNDRLFLKQQNEFNSHRICISEISASPNHMDNFLDMDLPLIPTMLLLVHIYGLLECLSIIISNLTGSNIAFGQEPLFKNQLH